VFYRGKGEKDIVKRKKQFHNVHLPIKTPESNAGQKLIILPARDVQDL
jgi:hypothetical protein